MKYIVGIVLIALVIVGVSLLNRDKKSDSKDNKSVPSITSNTPTIDTDVVKETVVTQMESISEIVYTSTGGFTPDNISVKSGTTIKFVDKSKEKMWVAVDEHPTHTKYDGTNLQKHCAVVPSTSFDQCMTGDEYSFTFTKTGTWDYHNHVRSRMGGKITVK